MIVDGLYNLGYLVSICRLHMEEFHREPTAELVLPRFGFRHPCRMLTPLEPFEL